MGGRVLFGAGVVAAMIVAAACSSFSDADETPPLSEAGTDSSVDTDASDATASDGGADSTTDAGTAPPFCLTDGGVFCADFDDPGAAPFAALPGFDAGFATLTDAGAASPPNAMRFGVVPRSDPTECSYAQLNSLDVDVPVPVALHAEFKMRVVQHAADGNVAVGPDFKRRQPGVGQCDLYFHMNAAGMELVAEGSDGTSTTYPLTRRPVLAQWSQFAIDIEGATQRTIRISVDGQPAVTPSNLNGLCNDADHFSGVDVGLYCVPQAAGLGVEVWYDDIRVITQ